MSTTKAAAILAGGDGRRLGGLDKALLSVGGQRLVDLVLAILKPQADRCALCLREQTEWSKGISLPVLLDQPSAGRGPLGGVAAALAWSKTLTPAVDWVITVPVDLPLLPLDLVARLTSEDPTADVVVAKSGDKVHYGVAAWKPSLRDALLSSIEDKSMAVHQFQSTVKTAQVDWPIKDRDPFFNVNTPEDLAIAESEMARSS